MGGFVGRRVSAACGVGWGSVGARYKERAWPWCGAVSGLRRPFVLCFQDNRVLEDLISISSLACGESQVPTNL